MKIEEIIKTIKKNCKGLDFKGNPIDDATSRDQVLYGDDKKECTGIIVTCFANINVIEKAHEKHVNFIIAHEALFWNHGDHQDWLANNEAFIKKKKLLDDYDITVWRFHDYIHSGIHIRDDFYADGIYYGWMKSIGWEEYLLERKEKPLVYVIPETTVKGLAHELMQKFNLNGFKVIGNPDAKVHKVFIAEHIQGRGDNEKLSKIAEEDIDTILTLELTDSSVTEYIRDASLLGINKTILTFGHFNTEEIGMQYMEKYLPTLFNENVNVTFVRSSDMYNYIVNENQNWK